MAVVEGAVGDVDVGGVLFEGDCIVAIVDGPAKEGYVVGVELSGRSALGFKLIY